MPISVALLQSKVITKKAKIFKNELYNTYVMILRVTTLNYFKN